MSEQTLPVIILCGGRGARLRPATDTIPKALVRVNGRPILDHILDLYQNRGLRRFVLCIGYRGDAIRHHYERPLPGISLEISDAGEEVSMLQRLCRVRDCIQSRALVSYGDTFADLDVAGVCSTHERTAALATIVLAPIRSPFGLVTFNGNGDASSFVEKPLLHYYIGHFVIERAALDLVDAQMLELPDGVGLVALFQRLIDMRRLSVFLHEGLQITFNTEPERRLAEDEIRHFFTFREDI